MAVGAPMVAALVLLAGGLSGHAKLCGDLRPPDAQDYALGAQRSELRLGLLLRNSGVPDLFKHLGGSGRSIPRGQFRWLHWWPPRRGWMRSLGSRYRLALSPAHVIEDAGEVRQSWGHQT